jgi:hypothetical protein
MAVNRRIALFGFPNTFDFDVRSSDNCDCAWQFHLPAAEED